MIKNKYSKLGLSIILDAVGMLTYFFPTIGELGDIGWAPISGWIMTKMYQGNVGKAAGLFSVIEEAIPGTDFIPTFTIMWVYTYVFKKDTKQTAESKKEDDIK